MNQHRQNTDFQLAYFLAGSCSTPDGAWNVMYGQKLAIENALEAGKAQRLDIRIKKLKAERVLAKTDDEIERLEAERDIIEANNSERMLNLNEKGAQGELDTINALMEKLEPLCKYETSDVHAHQEASQWEEWKGEFKSRAENMLLANSIGIPYDHIQAMRSHPDFNKEILPHLLEVGANLSQAARSGNTKILEDLLTSSPLLQLENKE